jgi:hypothetical protein
MAQSQLFTIGMGELKSGGRPIKKAGEGAID